MASSESGNSLLDLIEQYWYVPAGLMAVLIILVVLRFVRARQEDEFDRSLGRLQPSFETSRAMPCALVRYRAGAHAAVLARRDVLPGRGNRPA